MQEATLSPWFDLDEQKPWTQGVYEVQIMEEIGKFSYWCGKEFHWVGGSVEYAQSRFDMGERKGLGEFVSKWRGLSSAPSPKPKPRGNPKVARYVVMSFLGSCPVASFENKKAALAYSEAVNFPVRVKKIRFRSPEASKK